MPCNVLVKPPQVITRTTTAGGDGGSARHSAHAQLLRGVRGVPAASAGAPPLLLPERPGHHGGARPSCSSQGSPPPTSRAAPSHGMRSRQFLGALQRRCCNGAPARQLWQYGVLPPLCGHALGNQRYTQQRGTWIICRGCAALGHQLLDFGLGGSDVRTFTMRPGSQQEAMMHSASDARIQMESQARHGPSTAVAALL